VLVPTEEVVELVKGKRRTSARKFYPGYILVRMELDDETWHIVNDTAKVTGFLGGVDKPAPMTDEEAEQISTAWKPAR
jgi:transcriptional antiterminator NusG